MKIFMKLLIFLPFAIAFTACGDKGGGGKSSGAGSSRYYWNGGQCVDRNSNYPVANTLCTTSGSGSTCQPPVGYRYTNGVCYDAQNYPTNPADCNCTTTYPQPGGYPTPGSYVCNGTYYQPTYYGYQTIQCSTYNYYCRGLFLYDQYGNMVTCQ